MRKLTNKFAVIDEPSVKVDINEIFNGRFELADEKLKENIVCLFKMLLFYLPRKKNSYVTILRSFDAN